MKHQLCHISDFSDSDSREFSLQSHNHSLEVFVIYSKGEYYAYKNSCPHTGVNLNWQPDLFLDSNKNFIQCSMHNALFEINSGYCVAGPCKGSSLVEVELTVSDGIITVLI